MQTKTNQRNMLLQWSAPVRTNPVRSEKWYLTGGLLCATLVTYGILTAAWSLSLVFAFVPALYFLSRNQDHKDHSIQLLEDGIEFDGVFRPYSDFREFWILQGPGYYELHIAPVKQWKPEIVIQTGVEDPFHVRDVLGAFLPQIAHQKERILDAFIRFCKL